MSISGFNCNVSKISCCMLSGRSSSTMCGIVPPSIYKKSLTEKIGYSTRIDKLIHRASIITTGKIKSGIYASFGDMADDSTAIFPRIHVKDPYKRLGVSREASEEEIQAARNFLINKYAGHKPSVDAIESAHDRIIMQSFHDRKNPKINFKKKIREVTQSRVVKAVSSRFETPDTKVIVQTSIAFLVIGILTVLFPTEEGPTLQVAVSLIMSVYFIYQRLKSRIRAFLYGIGAFLGSWLLGTFLMVSIVPPLLKGPRSLEVTTSLITYVLLWVSSAYLK